MGRKTQNVVELEALLAEVVTPTLRAAGFRKSSHTYRRRLVNGDEAAIQFRAYALAQTCSFLLDTWVCLEPIWDMLHFDPDRARSYPVRSQPYDGVIHMQLGPAFGWRWSNDSERAATVRDLDRLLQAELLPMFDRMLSRDVVLRMARDGVGDFATAPGCYERISAYRALLADCGPADELQAFLRGLDLSDTHDRRYVAWVDVRLHNGPAWKRFEDGFAAHELDS